MTVSTLSSELMIVLQTNLVYGRYSKAMFSVIMIMSD